MQFRIAGSPHMTEDARRQLHYDIQAMHRGIDVPGKGLRDFEKDKLDRTGISRLKKEVGRFKKQG